MLLLGPTLIQTVQLQIFVQAVPIGIKSSPAWTQILAGVSEFHKMFDGLKKQLTEFYHYDEFRDRREYLDAPVALEQTASHHHSPQQPAIRYPHLEN